MNALAAALVVLAAAPCLAQAPDFDQGIDVRAVLRSVRPAAPVRAADMPGAMWTTTDDKTVVLKPGQTESGYVSMESDEYQDQCVTPNPWVGPICTPQVLFRDNPRFKLVLTAPIPASWGPQTFRLHLDVLRRPSLSVAVDGGRKFEFVLPGEFEDVLKVTPATGAAALRSRN